MSSPTTVDLKPTEAHQFMQALFGEYEAGGFVEFRLIGKGKTAQKFIPLPDALTHFPEILEKLRAFNDQGANIYFGALPRDREAGSADAISRCRILWVDVDEKSVTDIPDRFNRLIDQNLAPSYVILTGHGVHAYWLLRDTYHPEKCRPIMDALAAHLGGDPVSDPPRILRLPATMNTKGEPVPCLVFKQTGRTYNLSDFDVVVATAPARPTRPIGPGNGSVHPGNTNGNGHGLAARLAQALAPYWKENQRHHVALATAGLLQQAEFTRDEAGSIVRAIASTAGDPEVEDRLRAVETTYDGRDVAGSALLFKVLGNTDAARFLKTMRDVIGKEPPKPVLRKRFPDFSVEACAPIMSGFFQKYFAHAYDTTDAPMQYHVAAAATLVAAALGNRVWTTYPKRAGKLKLFPTLYTLLAAKTSRSRKSTSIGIARSVIRATGVEIFPNNATPEQLYVKMAPDVAEVEEVVNKKGDVKEIPVAWRGSPAGIIFHPEFSALLASAKKSYMADIFTLYMDLYDGSADGLTGGRETKSSGRYFVIDPAISMLAGVTPAGLRDHLEKTSMADGFMTRFLYLLSPPGHETRRPWESEGIQSDAEAAQAFASLTDELTILSKMEGAMEPDVAAIAVHQAFDNDIDRRIKQYEEDGSENMDVLVARLPSMAVKLSMIYACALGSHPVITAEASTFGCNFCRYVADTAEAFFSAMRPDDKNRDATYIRHLLDLLRRMASTSTTTGVSRRVLLQRAHLDAAQFDRAMATLIEEGRVIQRRGGALGAQFYVLNEAET